MRLPSGINASTIYTTSYFLLTLTFALDIFVKGHVRAHLIKIGRYLSYSEHFDIEH
jgi:hypothetical protein